MPPLKAKNIFTNILYSINSEFSFIQLLVHQKRASLYQHLPWLQRRLVVTIRVNTMTSLSHCHLCFCPGSWNQMLSVVLKIIGRHCFPISISIISPYNTPTHLNCFLHVCLHFQHSTLTSPSVTSQPWKSGLLLI